MRAPTHMDNVEQDGVQIRSEREDFSDYLWMEDVESFDKQVLAELEEEEEMEQCMEEMLAEEEARDTTYYILEEQNPFAYAPDIFHNVQDVDVEGESEEDEGVVLHTVPLQGISNDSAVFVSELNPNAAEFVPSSSRAFLGRSAASTTDVPDR